MVQAKVDALTKSQVNKAGKKLRGIYGPEPIDVKFQAFSEAYKVLLRYRASHQRPLTKATMGLRSRVVTVGCERVEVSQRLKRIPTIVDKLNREPKMQLGTMQDIGGCRAILENIDEIRRVQKRLKNKAIRVYDYIEKPRDSGYRGVHVVVVYDDRMTEVQLRTGLMHQWAYTVERLSGRLGVDLKGGHGPEPVLLWLKAVSEAMAFEEMGNPVDKDSLDRLESLRLEALPFMEGGS